MITVITKPIVFYSSENIPTGFVVFLGYIFNGWNAPISPNNQKIDSHCFARYIIKDEIIPLETKTLEAKGKAAR